MFFMYAFTSSFRSVSFHIDEDINFQRTTNKKKTKQDETIEAWNEQKHAIACEVRVCVSLVVWSVAECNNFVVNNFQFFTGWIETKRFNNGSWWETQHNCMLFVRLIGFAHFSITCAVRSFQFIRPSVRYLIDGGGCRCYYLPRRKLYVFGCINFQCIRSHTAWQHIHSNHLF